MLQLVNQTHTQFKQNEVEAIVDTVFIPRISIIPSDSSLTFKCLQLLLKSAFAKTITKALIQTFQMVRLPPRESMFFSRAA